MTAPQPATPGSDSVREHASNPDQLMASALGVCWHSPTSDRWPCTTAAPCPPPRDGEVCVPLGGDAHARVSADASPELLGALSALADAARRDFGRPVPPPEPPFRFSMTTQLKYDRERGELQELVDDKIRSVTHVRASLVDSALRVAVILELEKLGYTITSPEPPAELDCCAGSYDEQGAAHYADCRALAGAGEQQREQRERIAAWEFARHAPARYWGSPTLPDEQQDAYDAADELLALLGGPRPDGEAVRAARACWCARCEGVVLAHDHPTDLIAQLGGRRFIVCSLCGDKRCPRAAHHDAPCTSSAGREGGEHRGA